MTALTKLQQRFQDCVLHPGQPAATAWISASGRAAPGIQLSIYSHAYAARLYEVLANDYPATQMAIGDEYFNALAADYIQAHPSHYFSLANFGQHLPGFITEKIQQDESYRAMPWLVELAEFEWTLGLAFNAADTHLVSEQDMAGIPVEAWPELRFILRPCVHRLNFKWNIPEIWQALTTEPPTAVKAEHGLASPWLVWRQQLVTQFRSMASDEQLALDTVGEGGSFNDVCEVLATLMNADEVPLRAAGLLKGWIGQGLICGQL